MEDSSDMHQMTFPLWEDRVPNALGSDPEKDTPSLTAYFPPPSQSGGAAIVICPGGGYAELADYEGKDYALWLNERGIAAFVLKYRLGSNGYRHASITLDAARAIRLVRSGAPGWGLDINRIGIMGSSAGGHLASTTLVHFDQGRKGSADPVECASSRPDFGILCYPVITMGPKGEPGTRRNLLGLDPKAKDIEFLSSEKHVTGATPPCFLWHTQDDEVVALENTLCFAVALHHHKVPISLHVYPSGPHGLGLGLKGYTPGDKRTLHPWTRELEGWLISHGVMSPR